MSNFHPRPAPSLWAPFASQVQLETVAGCVSLTRDASDWWQADALPAGERYRFVVDEVAMPDPRGARLPDGVDGWSEVVDLDSFQWTDASWRGFPLADAVIYELHVGTFTRDGTFDAAIERLDHLAELGVNAIELMPVASFPGRHGWGYDGVGLFAVHQPYGGPEGLQRFVDAAHGLGLAVIIDVVYNHLGPSGNYLPRLGPYFTRSVPTPWGSAVNFDEDGSPEVRRFVIDNALQWVVQFHADGLRLDAVHEIHDTSEPHIVRELADVVHEQGRELGREVWVIAEHDPFDRRLVEPADRGGHGLDGEWFDPFHHGLHVALSGERTGYYGRFDGLIDLAAAYRLADIDDGSRGHLVGFGQNHDQIGNRATGDRLEHMITRGRAQIAAALVLTAPFVPLLFQGEEWAASTPFQYFTDHHDPRVAEAVRVGRPKEFEAFGWSADEIPDPQDRATWSRSVLSWDEVHEPHHSSMLQWYRALIALRTGSTVLRDGGEAGCDALVDVERRWIRIRRGEFEVVANLGDDQSIDVRPESRVALSNDRDLCEGSAVGSFVHLRADGVVILRQVS